MRLVVLGLMSALAFTVACDTAAGSDDGGGSERATDIAALTGDTGSGETLYNANCASCHGADRAGTGAGPDIRNEVDETGEVIDIILDGKAGMPAFGATLSDQEVADILAFLQG